MIQFHPLTCLQDQMTATPASRTATAGANGTINRLKLPGKYGIVWTGMKVLKHDMSQHHLIGIQPTVTIKRTLEGVLAGRDEVIEKAIEIINQK